MCAKPTIHAIFANYCSGVWVSYTLLSLLDGMQGAEVDTHAYVLGRGRDIDRGRVTPLLSDIMFRLRIDKLFKDPTSSLVHRFQNRFNPGDVAYFWLDSPVAVVRELQSRGLFIVREMINCTLQKRARELQTAYAALGERNRSGITTENIRREREQLLSMDAVFCPNDAVHESVLEYGVPASRCIRTSYGWGEDRIDGNGVVRMTDRPEGLVVLFVGTGDVRKGVPWLLQAWSKANVRGELRLAGVIDSEVRTRCAAMLARDDVRQLGYVHDVRSAYASADVFCFPSWEEGGPLVTIEAMASGLPCVVTPMGSAGIVKNGQEGIIVEPGDADGLAAAFVKMAASASARRRIGEQARATAHNFTWRAVGERRVAALLALKSQRA